MFFLRPLQDGQIFAFFIIFMRDFGHEKRLEPAFIKRVILRESFLSAT